MEKDNEFQKYQGEARTEEVEDIIERMPIKFGFYICFIVVFLFLLLLFFGWMVRYPDVIRGQIVINTSVSPIKLIANSSGKIRLNDVTSQSVVKGGDVVAYIKNSTSYDTLKMITDILKSYAPNDINNTLALSKLPTKIALGELSSSYYTFLGSLIQLQNFNSNRFYDKQIKGLSALLDEQNKQIDNNQNKLNLSEKSVRYSYKFLKRDSLLYKEKVSAEADLDKAQLEYLNSKNNYSNALTAVIESNKEAKQTTNKITEIEIQKNEKNKELELNVIESFNALRNNILLWEQKYLFKAPFDGRIQFLRFWTDDQFVQTGEQVFTIVPNTQEPYGQLYLPAVGAGKVMRGQEVIIKLNDFPYLEYGSIKGSVADMSLTTNTEKTQEGNVETYLVTVKFENGLRTNYKKEVAFKHEARGIGEVITNDRRLIERFFDNLKYILR